MTETSLVHILEGAILAAGKPLTVQNMADLFDEEGRPQNTEIREALKEVAERCEDRGFELQEVASGFRFAVRQELSPWVGRLWVERPQKYSRALLETLALIAYRQPITRGEIEEIRGVAVSSNIIKTLHERDWIRVVGHRDVPGRPAMYATTRQFLDYFNLKNLDQLPALAEIRDFDTLTKELGFEDLEEPKTAEPSGEEPAAEETGAEASADDESGLEESLVEEVSAESVEEQDPADADETTDELATEPEEEADAGNEEAAADPEDNGGESVAADDDPDQDAGEDLTREHG